MTRKQIIDSLRATPAPIGAIAPGEFQRAAARALWVKEIMAELRAAQKRADDAWLAAVAALPEDHTDEELEAIPEPPEQAELDAIRAQVDAVIEEDRWPRKLYWSL